MLLQFRKGHNFWSNRWINLKIIEELPDAVFIGVDVETPLGEAEVSSLQTRVPVRKGPNFWADRWITLKIVEEFPDAGFHGLDVESQLGEAEVSSLQTRVQVWRAITFDPTVISPLKL